MDSNKKKSTKGVLKVLNGHKIDKVGYYFIKEGLVNKDQIEQALKEQEKFSNTKDKAKYLGQVLVDLGFVSDEERKYILEKHRKRIKVGELLISLNKITRQQLSSVLRFQRRHPDKKIGRILVDLGYITEEELIETISQQLDIPYLHLSQMRLDKSLSKHINLHYAMKNLLVPVARMKDLLTVAMNDPMNYEAIDEMRTMLGSQPSIVIGTEEDILKTIHILYDMVKTDGDSPSVSRRSLSLAEKQTVESQYVKSYKVENIVNQIIATAVERNASDIHIETQESSLDIRFRIDGILQKLPLGISRKEFADNSSAICSKIKILADLDIAEKRRSQDGSFRVREKIGHVLRTIDFRVSIINTIHGENLVLRLLDQNRAPKGLEALGFDEKTKAQYLKAIQNPAGLVLLSGPTGSGKTTTLYSSIGAIYSPEKKILTVEDPIEYTYKGITQTEINQKLGITFASQLRSILRQDPDVIMVGEIRDRETAQMVIQAAQTGHLVLCTVHTMDSIGSAFRLMALGVEPSYITTSLICVLNQRLLRKVCFHCKKPYLPEENLLDIFFKFPSEHVDFFHGKGCRKCNYTGYFGRTVASEIWIPTLEEEILINQGATAEKIREESITRGAKTLVEDCARLISTGETTLEETLRTIPYDMIARYRECDAGSIDLESKVSSE